MRRKLFSLLLFVSAGVSAQQNPMLWADFPDPDVIRVDDTFYMVSTTMHQFPGAPIMQSKDLINWQLASYVFERLEDSPKYDMQEGTVYGRGQWATSLKYHNGRFYVLFAPNEGGEMGRTYIYSAEQAGGPWTLVSRLPHFHDASLLFDDDGRVYVFYGTGEQVELSADLQHVVEGSHRQLFQREADETGILEGSRVVKHRGRYYLLMISQVWAPGRNRRQVCYRSEKPEGPYEKHIILESPYGGFPHAGQGTIVDTQYGDWYAIIFQDRGAIGRVPLLMPCRWIDGWPMLGDEDGRIPEHMRPLVSGQPATPVVVSDDFNSEELDAHWQWNHHPNDKAWTLTERPGWLRLKTSRVVSNFYLAPNTLSQRMEGPRCQASVTLDVSHLKDGDCAGFSAFNGQSCLITLKRQGRRLSLEMSEQQVNLNSHSKAVESVDEKVVEHIDLSASRPLPTVVYLRIDGDFRPGRDIATFYYSLDGQQWKQIGGDYKMRFDWQRLFMGTRYALFCYATKRLGGYVDIDGFSYRLINEE
ncbi:MAG: glycoside hydrolase 43 family protein [Prevotella sp.]|nr:glycoside hydrolase 43 family protein [Prevotella sp.]